jgi:hypothetical protein
MKNLLFFIAVLACVNMTFSQVQLFVKKGSLTIGQTTYQAGAVISLKSTDKVLTSEKTKAIAKKQAQLIELEKDKTYTYKQLEKKLDGKSNFTQAFINAATSKWLKKAMQEQHIEELAMTLCPFIPWIVFRC